MDKYKIEDYFQNDEICYHDNKKLVLVIYDIVSTKRRNKLIKILEGYGLRVQKSAFEMIMSDLQYNKLIDKISKFVDETDNIRVYKLKIKGEVVSWGSAATEPEEIIFI